MTKSQIEPTNMLGMSAATDATDARNAAATFAIDGRSADELERHLRNRFPVRFSNTLFKIALHAYYHQRMIDAETAAKLAKHHYDRGFIDAKQELYARGHSATARYLAEFGSAHPYWDGFADATNSQERL